MLQLISEKRKETTEELGLNQSCVICYIAPRQKERWLIKNKNKKDKKEGGM